jgi:hypothetical protein
MMTVNVHGAESANDVQGLQPPEEPQEGSEEDLRGRGGLKRKAAGHDREANDCSSSAKGCARESNEEEGSPESDEESDHNDYRGHAGYGNDDNEEKDAVAPTLRDALEYMDRLHEEDRGNRGEPAPVPVGRSEQGIEALTEELANAKEENRRLTGENNNLIILSADARADMAALKAKLAKAEEENHRLMEKNNELIRLRMAAERKLREARRLRTVHRNEEELPDVSWDLEVQRGETIRMHGLTEAFRKRLDETRDERDAARAREEKCLAERDEAERREGLAKEDHHEAEELLGEADATLKAILYICDNRDREENESPLDEANAAISSIQYMCANREF